MMQPGSLQALILSAQWMLQTVFGKGGLRIWADNDRFSVQAISHAAE